MIEPDMVLSDGVIILQPADMKNAQIIFQAAVESLEDLKPWMSWAHDGYSINETRTYLESLPQNWADGKIYGFSIFDATGGDFLGGSGLNIISTDYRSANLGYWVRSSRRGEGIAVRATRLLAHFAIERLGLVRVEIVVAEGNTASLRVAEKAGAMREGLQRNRIIVGEKIYNAWMHSIIPQDLDM